MDVANSLTGSDVPPGTGSAIHRADWLFGWGYRHRAQIGVDITSRGK